MNILGVFPCARCPFINTAMMPLSYICTIPLPAETCILCQLNPPSCLWVASAGLQHFIPCHCHDLLCGLPASSPSLLPGGLPLIFAGLSLSYIQAHLPSDSPALFSSSKSHLFSKIQFRDFLPFHRDSSLWWFWFSIHWNIHLMNPFIFNRSWPHAYCWIKTSLSLAL